MKRVNLVFN